LGSALKAVKAAATAFPAVAATATMPPSPAPFAPRGGNASQDRVLLVKERIYHPLTSLPPTQKVNLSRPEIFNNKKCGNKANLREYARRKSNKKVFVDLNVYNRYHGAFFDIIPMIGELRAFHINYSAGDECKSTSDLITRRDYVLWGFETASNIPLLSWISGAITEPAFSKNTAFTELKARHYLTNKSRIASDGSLSADDDPQSFFSYVKFHARAEQGSRTELTIFALDDGLLFKPAWEIDWEFAAKKPY
jgi:hypothetical protein